MTRWSVTLGIFVMLGLFLLGVEWARAHNAPAGWQYDPWCCNASDCQQLAEGDVVERDGGWWIISRQVHIPYSFPEKRASGDQHFHYCEYPRGVSRCFYIPGGDT